MEKEIELREDQQKAYDRLILGNNIFISGEAGTGKSELIKKFIRDSREKGLKVVVTAPTGIAADHIGGTTIHRAFEYPAEVINAYGENRIVKVKTKKYDKETKKSYTVIETKEKTKRRFAVSKALLEADIVIVDEISSLRMDVFTLLATQIQDTNKKRNMDKSINGKGLIQLVVCGDVFQTGPVSKPELDEPNVLKQLYSTYNEGYAFESTKWDEMKFEYINLKQVIRQEDKVFSDALGLLRKGDVRVLDWLNNNIHKKWDGETIVICGTNDEVSNINSSFLSKLSGKEYVFKEIAEPVSGYILNDTDRRNDTEVKLKVGARVMCLVNDKDDRYHNGSLGVIKEIKSDSCVVKFDKYNYDVEVGLFTWEIKNGLDEVIGTIKQIPLKLGYAITVHKVQGQTFDKICLKPDIYFGPAMHYVAVGRCKTLDGIQFYGNKFTNKVTFKSGYQKDINLVSYEVLEFAKENGIV